MNEEKEKVYQNEIARQDKSRQDKTRQDKTKRERAWEKIKLEVEIKEK